MATVFMQWLQRRPKRYELGIRLLTLGRLRALKQVLLGQHEWSGLKVMDLGCGPGDLTCQLAQAGAEVEAIDVDPAMVELAQSRVHRAGLDELARVQRMDASRIGEEFSPEVFDMIVMSLVLSEWSAPARGRVLAACADLLKPGCELVVIEECIPEEAFGRLMYHAIRFPLAGLTWLLTGTSTRPLRDPPRFFEQSGFSLRERTCTLGGGLCLFRAVPEGAEDLERPLWRRLRHRSTLRTRLLDLWAFFLRIVPPYPKVEPGLYAVGSPDRAAPVLVTGNFELSVRQLVRALDGRLAAWILVVDTRGVNVWCASGAGFLRAGKVAEALRATGVERVVRHRDLVLPQLSAVGVDGRALREESGWVVHWGPVAAEDIPAYLERGRRKTDRMRLVSFPLKDRLVMVSGTLGFYGLILLAPIAIFWPHLLLPTTFALLGLSYFYAAALPWIPGRDGLRKSAPMALIAIAGMLAYSALWSWSSAPVLFNRAIGVTAVAAFVSAEFQGMSPHMRGEQANWLWEVLIGGVLGLLYWLLPLAIGWR